jgi:hypothetical protein
MIATSTSYARPSRMTEILRKLLFVAILTGIGGLAFAAGLAYSALASRSAHAGEAKAPSAKGTKATGGPRVIYPKRTDLDFEGLKLQGEVRSPGEFYFQHRNEEKFDSLVKRRKNFHQEMLRDAVLSK